MVPGFPPIVWQPSRPNVQLQTLTFYVVPDARLGVPCSAVISAGGRAPITYAATSLPQGLTVVGNTITITLTQDLQVTANFH